MTKKNRATILECLKGLPERQAAREKARERPRQYMREYSRIAQAAYREAMRLGPKRKAINGKTT
jgi:hypothetical protein